VYTREFFNGARRLYWYDISTGRDEHMHSEGDYNEWQE
jgi:hypothetical protein